MVKYKQYFKDMCDENKVLFDEFLIVHNQFKADKRANQNAFNQVGIKVRSVVEDWDRKLCGRMEKGTNAAYSSRLSEKFWGEVRLIFPLIDFVGATIR